MGTFNPADHGTRGLKADDQKWESLPWGPPFLRSLEKTPPFKLVSAEEIEEQIELKRTMTQPNNCRNQRQFTFLSFAMV
ncbi:unnamed protein product [Echinostoma caproni]|uniref:Uncharacterized protein n=1 Tax=Echinostoma caproni TaxID=27848 RepID=A0A183AJA5_9TREM|nr:unnamed protein product [Echinostoma caproni]